MNAALIRKFKIRGTIPNGVVKNLDYINTPALVNLEVFTRATPATMLDQDAIVRYAASGQVRMQGQRVVTNLVTTPSNTLGIAGTRTVTLASASTIVFSMGAGTGTATFSGTSGATGTLTANATFRTANTQSVAAGTYIVTASVAALADLQIENVTGQTNQNPGEYVSVGVLAAPWQGAGLDGAQYFSTLNGNTVAANVVTETTGAAISTSGKFATLPGVSGAYFSTPNAAANQITGNLDIRALIATSDYTISQTILARDAGTAAYTLQLSRSTGDGKLALIVWQAGAFKLSFSSVPATTTNNVLVWVRVTLDTSIGAVTFYTSQDGVNWAQLGTTQFIPAAATDAGNSALAIGSYSDGTGNFFKGKIYRAQIYNGINGTLAVDYNPNNWSTGSTWASTNTSETWTINGSASVYAQVQGYLAELTATNSALQSRDMTNAAWVKTNATAALTSVGMDGAANSASRLTATAANGTILQTLTAAAVARTYSYGVKRITGTGNIQITQDGAAWTTVTTTGAYTIVQLTATQLNPVFGIRIVTSGDAIDVDFNQIELGNAATSSIPTTTVAVTRNADALYVPSAGIISVLQPYTVMVQTAGVMNIAGTQALCGSDVNYMAQLALVTSGANATFTNDNGTLSATKAFGSLSASTKYVGRKGAINQDVFANGVVGTPSAIGTPVSEITKLYIGCHNANSQLNGVVQKLRIVRGALTNAQVPAL